MSKIDWSNNCITSSINLIMKYYRSGRCLVRILTEAVKILEIVTIFKPWSDLGR